MHNYATSLIREKFEINDPNISYLEYTEPLLALSNRIEIDLVGRKKEHHERFIVRTQNMHSCVRLSARIVDAFERGGPIMNRAIPIDWDQLWTGADNEYEHTFNSQLWCAVYYQGKCIFEKGKRHLFLDVIEKCYQSNPNSYEKAIPLAEEAFRKTGKTVQIGYDSNVALVVNLEKLSGRIGIILRGPDRTTTFNFSVKSKNKKPLAVPKTLFAAAAFLEAVQLAFMVGMNNEKIRLGIIERFSQAEKQTRAARGRLGRLAGEIANFEEAYDVRYRPEKPSFHRIINDAERLAISLFEPTVE